MINLDSLNITPEILNLIAEIDEFKGAWQQAKFPPDRLGILRKIATIESIGSSTRIEGATLSDREVEALLSGVGKHSFETRDEQEVAGYAFVCEEIFSNYRSIPFSESSIMQLHKWLLQYTDKDERHRGQYKNIPIRIEAFDADGKSVGVIFETTSPMETPIQMHALIDWTNRSLADKIYHPLIVIGIFIVIFLAIHPFQDGNGRLSRLLTTLLLLKSGYQYTPYSSLESIVEANKKSYYLALQKTQKDWRGKQPNWNPWLLFFLHCLQRQKKHLEVKMTAEQMLLEKLSPLESRVLDLLKEHGRLGISDIALLTQANRNTLKKALARLVQNGHLSLQGRGKSSLYRL